MKRLIRKILRKKNCDHSKNFRMRKYFSQDGTPMIEFNCYDCNYKDNGHVYCDSHDWETHLIVKENGIVTINHTGAIDSKHDLHIKEKKKN